MAEPGVFATDTDGLATAAPSVSNLSSALQSIYDNLTDALAAAHALPGSTSPPWGDDAAGKAFANNYVSSAETAYDGLKTAAQGAQAVSGSIQHMAGGLAGVEDAAKQAAS